MKEMTRIGQSRGFVTMATGRDEYYVLAHNLLLSYKRHCADPLPFSIICDRENEWTADFDSIVPIKDPYNYALDKLFLVKGHLPYDETIFIDADSLVYKDLSPLWKLFEGGPDFGLLGATFPLDSKDAYFTLDEVGPYAHLFKRYVTLMTGFCFIRRGEALESFSRTCQDILENYDSLSIKMFPAPFDDPIFSIACSVHELYPVADYQDVEIWLEFPFPMRVRSNISSGKLRWSYRRQRTEYDSYVFHFGNRSTRKAIYRLQVRSLKSRRFSWFWEMLTFIVEAPAHVLEYRPSMVLKRLAPYKFKTFVYGLLHGK